MADQTDWNLLTGPQIWALSEAIRHAYPAPLKFNTFLSAKLDKGRMEDEVLPAGYKDMLPVFLKDVVSANGWMTDLISALQHDKPNNPLVRNLARTVHLTGSEPDKRFPPDNFRLEAIASGGGFSDIRQWLQAMAEISEATCRIESPADKPLGTGILVSPRYVLTNYHVAKQWSDDKTAVCRFGFAADPSGKATGQATALMATGAKVATSIDDAEAAKSNAGGLVLDFALLQLAQPMQAVKPLAMRVGNSAKQDSPALIVQHPSGSPQKLAIGKFMGVGGERWQYDADTEPGSSGSGVFNQKLELVALHHAGHEGSPSTTGFNQGISIDAIIGLLRQKQEIQKFW